MKIKVQIKRQEKQNTAPYIQHFLYEGDGKLTVADFLAELNRRDPLLTAEGLPASRITYESGCHEKNAEPALCWSTDYHNWRALYF